MATAGSDLMERDGPECLERFDWLTEAARARLTAFAACLRRWQATHNLISAATLDHLWTRHIADSLQLVRHLPGAARRWIDLGSGGGFPGLVVAIALADAARVEMTLVEANRKKAAFLRAAAREAGVRVNVIAGRIEDVAKRAPAPWDVISARAVAPLARLLELACPLAGADSRVLLLKGQDFVNEVKVASKSWEFDLVCFASVTDSGGLIAVISHARPKASDASGRTPGRTPE